MAANAQLDQLLARMRGGLVPELREVAGRHVNDFGRFASRFMHAGPPPDDGPNRTDKLYVRSGRLRGSLSTAREGSETKIESRDGVVTLRYGTSVVYARIHEYGGRAGSANIRPRPYAHPAAEAMRRELIPIIGEEMTRAVAALWGSR